MKVIGLTGGIGTGKSTVSAYLAQKGCIILDADQISRKIGREDVQALAEIRASFGDEFFDEMGNLRRSRLGEEVFGDESKRRLLESIVTRRVIETIDERLEELNNNGFEGIAVVDAPLIFECGMDEDMDECWVVVADLGVRISRIIKRDGLSCENIMERINSQMPDSEKTAKADYIIDNSKDLNHLYGQIDRLLERIENEKK